MIVGCGRVGAGLAYRLAKSGHDVTILDMSTRAFDRLPSDFAGHAVRGNGIDEDVLRRAGLEGSDVFLALTEGDNRNVFMAQLARETFAVPRVVAKVNDPVRADAYAALGLATLCRTTILEDAVLEYLDEPRDGLQRGVAAPTGHDHPLVARGDTDGTGASGGPDSPPGASGEAGSTPAYLAEHGRDTTTATSGVERES
jgi:trk system potassium uptake protein TrkA